MEINGEIVSENVRYADLGLSEPIMKALEKKGYEQATPVQGGAIPYFMEYKDVIAKAPTGTGKTFAFGIPMVEHIDPESSDVLALVLAPTRELAIQIRDELRDLCAFKEGVRTVCLYGGQPIDKQITQLKKRPQIVVATPGRLMDHVKRRTVRLDQVETVVLDEADRMLDMGFIRDVTRILDLMPQRRNLGLFSATISREVMDISWVYQRDPVEITVRADEQNKPDISQYRLDVDRNEKVDAMVRLMEIGGFDRVIAFCNTKNMTDRLSGLLRMRGVTCEAIHGDIQQRVREKTLQKFREGKLRVLAATDVAARGLDIDDVDAVFNYDVPDENEYYIHRIGRTGRAKRHGVAYSLVSNITEGIRLDDIQKNTGNQIQKMVLNDQGELEPADRPRDEAGERKRHFVLNFFSCFPDPGVHHLLCREHELVRQQFFRDCRHRVGPLPGIRLLGPAGGQLLLPVVVNRLAFSLPGQWARLAVSWLVLAACLALGYALAIPYLPDYFPRFAALHVGLAAGACALLMLALLAVLLILRRRRPERYGRLLIAWGLIVLGSAVLFLHPADGVQRSGGVFYHLRRPAGPEPLYTPPGGTMNGFLSNFYGSLI